MLDYKKLVRIVNRIEKIKNMILCKRNKEVTAGYISV